MNTKCFGKHFHFLFCWVETSSQNGSRRDKLSFTDDGVGVSGRDLVNGAKFVEDTESGFIWIDGGFDLVGGKNLQGSRKF